MDPRRKPALPEHYAILSLTPFCTPKEIKLAYRRLALEQHPDKNPDDPRATAKFQKLQEAHEVLSHWHSECNASQRKHMEAERETAAKREQQMQKEREATAKRWQESEKEREATAKKWRESEQERERKMAWERKREEERQRDAQRKWHEEWKKASKRNRDYYYTEYDSDDELPAWASVPEYTEHAEGWRPEAKSAERRRKDMKGKWRKAYLGEWVTNGKGGFKWEYVPSNCRWHCKGGMCEQDSGCGRKRSQDLVEEKYEKAIKNGKRTIKGDGKKAIKGDSMKMTKGDRKKATKDNRMPAQEPQGPARFYKDAW